jgi:hypothetical protein
MVFIWLRVSRYLRLLIWKKWGNPCHPKSLIFCFFLETGFRKHVAHVLALRLFWNPNGPSRPGRVAPKFIDKTNNTLDFMIK